MSDEKVTETRSRKTEWTDWLGFKYSKETVETKVDGKKTESGKPGK